MKVILLQDVPNVGRKYEVKNVSDGYARNFLIARNLAKLATSESIKKLEEQKKRHEEEKKIQCDLLGKNLDGLKDLKIVIDAKENEKGHLFAAIHPQEISKVLKEKHRLDIPAEMIEISESIKKLGEYKIKVKGREFVLEII